MSNKHPLSLEEKKKLLRKLIEKKIDTINYKLLVTPGQNALWNFNRAFPKSPAYHLKFTAEIVPSINIKKLRDAIAGLINRHSALRSYFSYEDGKLYQVFNKEINFEIVEKNCARENVEQNIIIDYSKPFDLNKAPLIRCFIYNISSQNQIILLVIHHIIIDGVSLLNLISQLGKIINNLLINNNPYDYQHYLKYIESFRDSNQYIKIKSYWQKKLKLVDGKLNLPYDRHRNTLPTYQAGTVIKILTMEQTSKFRDFANNKRITLHAFFLGIYQLLLHEISKEHRVLSVTPCLGRDKNEFFSIIGYFANMVVIDTDLKNIISIDSFLTLSSQALVDALSNQQLAFTELVQALSVDRSATNLPLAQAAFAFHQPITNSKGLNVDLFAQSVNELEWAGSKVKPFRVTPVACQFELYLVALEENNGEISLNFEFMRDVFDLDTIKAIADYYLVLLDVVVIDENIKLSELPEFEPFNYYKKDVAKFNDTTMFLPDFSLTRILYDSLSKNYNSIGIVDSLGEYTYAEFFQLSFGLANILPCLANTQVAIGILLEKGIGQIVSVLATLWSGNYFVPINIDNPSKRIIAIQNQADLKYIITTRDLAKAKQLSNISIIDLDSISAQNDFQIIDVKTKALIYAIFTSGTTGIPKGVTISHRSLLNTVLNINKKFQITANDSTFAISDLSFDLAMYDVFGMLLAGGKIVFCAQANVKEPKKWLSLINKHQITLWNSVPMLFSMLLEQIKSELPFKHVFLSGDWISVNVVNKAHDVCPKAQIVSLGGPTETTIWSIHYILKRKTNYDFIPYGYPLANHQYYVLNDNLSLCGYDQLGELYAGGLWTC